MNGWVPGQVLPQQGESAHMLESLDGQPLPVEPTLQALAQLEQRIALQLQQGLSPEAFRQMSALQDACAAATEVMRRAGKNEGDVPQSITRR